VRRRQAGQPRQVLRATRPFAGGDQNERQQGAEHHPDAGTDEALLDRVAHQKYAAERQRGTTDPNDPAGANPFLETGRSGRRRCRR
jgi:hypothetical protein